MEELVGIRRTSSKWRSESSRRHSRCACAADWAIDPTKSCSRGELANGALHHRARGGTRRRCCARPDSQTDDSESDQLRGTRTCCTRQLSCVRADFCIQIASSNSILSSDWQHELDVTASSRNLKDGKMRIRTCHLYGRIRSSARNRSDSFSCFWIQKFITPQMLAMLAAVSAGVLALLLFVVLVRSACARDRSCRAECRARASQSCQRRSAHDLHNERQ